MKLSRMFYVKFSSQKTKMFITATIVVSIISAAINLVDFLFGNVIAIVSTVFYLSAAITFLLYKNWMLPLVITIYSIIFTFLIFDGVSFIVGIISAIFGLVSLIKIRKINAAYEIYCKKGIQPKGVI